MTTDCSYRGVKVACLRKSVKVFQRELSTFAIKDLQNDTYNVICILNLMKI